MAVQGLSDERLKAIFKTDINDFELCRTYFMKRLEAVYSQETRYRTYKFIIGELKRRDLNCFIFPEFKDKKPFMEERIKLFEEQGGW